MSNNFPHVLQFVNLYLNEGKKSVKNDVMFEILGSD